MGGEGQAALSPLLFPRREEKLLSLKARVRLVREPGPRKNAVAVTTPADVAKVLKAAGHAAADREHFVCLHLTARRTLLSMEVVSIGTVSETFVHPREVFKGAILANAESIIVAHNHPSGDPGPSRDDLSVTRRLLDAGRLIGIELVDHVIIGADGYVSLKERGLLTGAE